jgi:hypothetical protein
VGVQPRPAGPLADILSRRRIAVGTDEQRRTVLARPDSLLARVDDIGRREGIAEWVQGWDHEQAERIATPGDEHEHVFGFETIRFPAELFDLPGEGSSLAGVSDLREELRSKGHDVALNHVVLGAPSTSTPLGASAAQAGDVTLPGIACRNNDGALILRSTAVPGPPPQLLRHALELPGRDRPKVLVMDSGLRTVDGAGLQPEHAELTSCFTHSPWLLRAEQREVDDEDEADVDQTGTLDFQAGHGTFIAGIVRQYCPDAEIYTCGVLTSFGEGSVSGVLHALRRVLALIGSIDVAVMSFGGYFENDDASMFGSELGKLLGGAVAVGSAGNDNSCRPYFPAALPDVVGVGGLAADGRAWFSNFGPWVDACAPATDVVSTFFVDYTEELDGAALRHFDGWARWSGTSFAAPKVAALIAQDRYLHGGTPKAAWQRLTSHGHLRHGDLGTVFNV